MAHIRQMTYQRPDGASAEVESMSFRRLRQLDHGATQRGDFHVVALVDEGRGTVALDFAEQALVAADVVWIGPGVVHRWVDIAGLEGHVVLFTATAPATPAARRLASSPGVAAAWSPPAGRRHLVAAALAHLRLESEAATAGPGPASEVLGSLLSVLLTRIEPPAGVATSGDGTFDLFRKAVEADLARRHDAGHYARVLGCSARTLSRAAQLATGRTAKDYIDERLVREAKRLLAHDGLSAAQCSARLGFVDPSGFSAFFRRETGQRPGEWRTRWT